MATNDEQARKVVGQAIIDGLIKVGGSSVTIPQDYAQTGAGDYHQSDGGSHSQSQGSYYQGPHAHPLPK